MAAVELVRGDILTLDVDAIVCPAHKHLIRGRGLSAQLYDIAGDALVEECREVAHCGVGEARMTRAYHMPARFILHTVTPQWSGGDQWGADAVELLRRCYDSVMKLALMEGLRTIAFPALGTGTNRMPQQIAAHVGLEMLHRYEDRFERLVVCLRSTAVLHEWQATEQQFFARDAGGSQN